MLSFKIKKIVTGLLIVPTVALALLVFILPASSAKAAPADQYKCSGDTSVCVTDTPDPAITQAKKCKPGSTDKCDFIASYVNPFIKLLSAAVGIAVVVGILIGGVEYISSGGDPQKAASGRKHIVNAVIGLVVYIFLFGLINFIIPGGI
ncbi:MAG: hypothetical protein QFB87_00705 [Patescibacteria group bacterium]|nr:hypothetical protein [Patescibacteria group bacterium]